MGGVITYNPRSLGTELVCTLEFSHWSWRWYNTSKAKSQNYSKDLLAEWRMFVFRGCVLCEQHGYTHTRIYIHTVMYIKMMGVHDTCEFYALWYTVIFISREAAFCRYVPIRPIHPILTPAQKVEHFLSFCMAKSVQHGTPTGVHFGSLACWWVISAKWLTFLSRNLSR